MASLSGNQFSRFTNFLASKGFALTGHKLLVFEAALVRVGIYKPEDVFASLQGQVSLATMHRTLNQMVESGVLRRVEFNGRPFLVEIVDDE